MLTMILSAVCAFGINATATMTPADTLDKYIINGEKIEKFNGSQLIGKTVSDYKVMTATSNTDGKVVRFHLISTDGQKIKDAKSVMSTDAAHVGDKCTEATVNVVKSDKSKVTVLYTSTVCVIDGKKCDKDDLNKIKPSSIASMTVYKAGSKEAVKFSGSQDVTVIEVITK